MTDLTPVFDDVVSEWPPFGVTDEEVAGCLVLTVTGELDMATSPALRERLVEATAAGASALVIDLRGVMFMDSVGLAAILHARSRLGEHGRLAIVLEQESYPQLVLETAGLPRSLALYRSLEAAVAHATR